MQVSRQLSQAAAAERAAELFRLLGDPTRIRILEALDRAGELCVHEIATEVDASETKVSQALRLLRAARVVRNRREGRHIHYQLDDDHVRELLRNALDHLTTDHPAHEGAGR